MPSQDTSAHYRLEHRMQADAMPASYRVMYELWSLTAISRIHAHAVEHLVCHAHQVCPYNAIVMFDNVFC
jgi:hypothetical protein